MYVCILLQLVEIAAVLREMKACVNRERERGEKRNYKNGKVDLIDAWKSYSSDYIKTILK